MKRKNVLKIYLKSKKKPFILEASSMKALNAVESRIRDALNDENAFVVFEQLTFMKNDFSHMIKS